jgi:hypothetical protein
MEGAPVRRVASLIKKLDIEQIRRVIKIANEEFKVRVEAQGSRKPIGKRMQKTPKIKVTQLSIYDSQDTSLPSKSSKNLNTEQSAKLEEIIDQNGFKEISPAAKPEEIFDRGGIVEISPAAKPEEIADGEDFEEIVPVSLSRSAAVVSSSKRKRPAIIRNSITEEERSKLQLSAAIQECQSVLDSKGFTITSETHNETILADEVSSFLQKFEVDGLFSTSIVTSLVFSFEWPPEYLVLHSSVLEHAESQVIPKSSYWGLKTHHKKIIIPCCFKFHWTLFRIELDDRIIYHHDSMANPTTSLDKSPGDPLYSYLLELLALQVPNSPSFRIRQGVSCLHLSVLCS